ncbi:MAG: hypothetical protein ACI4D0_01045 [Lachnospira sp.]
MICGKGLASGECAWGGDGSSNPNSTYSDWKWILVRTNGGHWQHVDHGY